MATPVWPPTSPPPTAEPTPATDPVPPPSPAARLRAFVTELAGDRDITPWRVLRDLRALATTGVLARRWGLREADVEALDVELAGGAR